MKQTSKPVTNFLHSAHNLHKRHPLLIPSGHFCYRTVPSDGNEQLGPSSPLLGRDFREAKWTRYEKMILCPYWEHTDHGTVRCEYLKREELAWQSDEHHLAVAHFGKEVVSRMETQSDLADMLKECDVRPEGPDRDLPSNWAEFWADSED
jgi:hypothetical protein